MVLTDGGQLPDLELILLDLGWSVMLPSSAVYPVTRSLQQNPRIADKTPETDSLRIGLKLPSQLLNLTLPVFERNIM